ncbi:class I SAM-dependent methyltransferase [Roseibium algae]|uniref:Class I SAM-dependent methyltransferase n=1 Tax=Roseibium algae TaxID=3123038 RepID=A0ABU8TJ17_9HYPH
MTSQYATSSNFDIRVNFAKKYSTKNWLGWLAERLPITSSDKVLDVGCGTGNIWLVLSHHEKYPGTLTLYDKSPAMLSKSTEVLKFMQAKSALTSLVGDAEDLPFEDNSFDTVLALHMLYHVKDQPKAVAEFARVLRPNGKLYLTSNTTRNMKPIFETAYQAFGQSGVRVDPGAHAFDPDTAKTLLSPHFQTVDKELFVDVYRVSSQEDVVNFLGSMTEVWSPTDTQIRSVPSHVSQTFKNTNGTLELDHECAMITATLGD